MLEHSVRNTMKWTTIVLVYSTMHCTTHNTNKQPLETRNTPHSSLINKSKSFQGERRGAKYFKVQTFVLARSLWMFWRAVAWDAVLIPASPVHSHISLLPWDYYWNNKYALCQRSASLRLVEVLVKYFRAEHYTYRASAKKMRCRRWYIFSFFVAARRAIYPRNL